MYVVCTSLSGIRIVYDRKNRCVLRCRLGFRDPFFPVPDFAGGGNGIGAGSRPARTLLIRVENTAVRRSLSLSIGLPSSFSRSERLYIFFILRATSYSCTESGSMLWRCSARIEIDCHFFTCFFKYFLISKIITQYRINPQNKQNNTLNNKQEANVFRIIRK